LIDSEDCSPRTHPLPYTDLDIWQYRNLYCIEIFELVWYFMGGWGGDGI